LRCYNKVLDKELPMRCEMFYANCLMTSRPEDVTLDLKQSTIKKQAKLFSVMEKKKLIVCKAIHKQDNIVSVDRTNKTFAEYCAAVDAVEAGAYTRSHFSLS
jgi:hypothetical protein